MGGKRPLRFYPVQEQVRRPAVRVALEPSVAVIDAAVHDRVAGAHWYRDIGLVAKVAVDRRQRLSQAALLDAQRPGNVFTELDGQREAVLTGFPVGMDPA